MINVIIADDHNLVREGIRALLEKAEDITVVGEAENGQDALTLVQTVRPDVLVMDIAMPGMNGIQVLEQLREMDLPTQVVILSMYADEIFVRQALQNGAKGYLLKGSFKEELLLTIRAASRGATYLSPSVSESVLTPPASSASSPADQLTPREHELLQLIAKGHTNAEIADLLNVSIKTVERHRTNLMTKLDARNIVELIRVAVRHRLIVLDD
jgi:DNA-binding NarL/FixJ family response regulator